MVDLHDGVLPTDTAALLALPGVGTYTAAAVSAFAHGRRSVVMDTNVRRVLARAVDGTALPSPSVTVAERQRTDAVVPDDDATASRWNAAVMELGALVCTARAPRCAACPIEAACTWRRSGSPPDAFTGVRRRPTWDGTDRQLRGQVMAALRAASGPVTPAALGPDWPEAVRERVLAGLVADGLAVRDDAGYRLPH